MSESYIYFPSCNLTRASPQASMKMRLALRKEMTVTGCCQHEHKPHTDNEIALVVCQACREIIESSLKMKTKTLWEYLDEKEDYVFPDYSGLVVNVQDCYRDRNHPEVHAAVRSLLAKMHIEIVELEENKEKSRFCGTLHYEPKNEFLQIARNAFPNTKISNLSTTIQGAFMKEHVHSYTCDLVVVDCNRCKRGVILGGGKAVHLMDLVTGTYKK